MVFLSQYALKIIVILGLLMALGRTAQAQCVWENLNCTPTPTTTPFPTGQPTPTLVGIVFEAPEFPAPTSIPAPEFPDVPDPLEATPIPAPSPLALEIIATPDFSATGSISIPIIIPAHTAVSVGSSTVQASESISQSVADTLPFVGEVIDYTNTLTNQIETIYSTNVITIISAPPDYVPSLPRPMADVGWTFEQLSSPNSTVEFSLASWASFTGYVASLPFQFIKSLQELMNSYGPLGLFIAWLLIMAALVFAVWLNIFIARVVIVILRLVIRLIELIGAYAPTGG